MTAERIERQEAEERQPWKTDEIKEVHSAELCNSILRLIKPELSQRLLALDYKKVLDGFYMLMKFCKDLNYQSQIRELYDILIKWVFLRLWGGNAALLSLVEMLPPVMSILQKKNLTLNDIEIELTIGVVREYFISAFLNDNKLS